MRSHAQPHEAHEGLLGRGAAAVMRAWAGSRSIYPYVFLIVYFPL